MSNWFILCVLRDKQLRSRGEELIFWVKTGFLIRHWLSELKKIKIFFLMTCFQAREG